MEEWRGTRRSTYVYVAEGGELVHISRYAVGEPIEDIGRHSKRVTYVVDTAKVSGKTLYCFTFTRKGRGSVERCSIWDFRDGLPERSEPVDFGSLNFRFRVDDPHLKMLLDEFYGRFTQMIDEIERYSRIKRFEIDTWWWRVGSALEDPKAYYYELMCMPSDKMRIMDLRGVMSKIYELWVLAKICEAIGATKFTFPTPEEPLWWLVQGSSQPTTICETPRGEASIWLEFQPNEYAHMMPPLEKGVSRASVRPDIIVVKGHFERTEQMVEARMLGPKPYFTEWDPVREAREIMRQGLRVDVLVECKTDEFGYWEKDIHTQLPQYRRAFNPQLFVLASLKSVPQNIKAALGEEGVLVVDGLGPDNTHSVGILQDQLRRVWDALP